MKLSGVGDIKRANTFHIFFKKQTQEYLEEQSISICPDCEGTGLSNVQILRCLNDERSWDGVSFCDECKGVGFLGVKGGLQVDLLHYICRWCEGDGCVACGYEGIVDWIDHSMGR